MPTGLAVKNGSKIRPRNSAGTPGPLSATSIRIRTSMASSRNQTRRGAGTASTAWVALSSRLSSTWWIWSASAIASGNPGASWRTIFTPLLRIP